MRQITGYINGSELSVRSSELERATDQTRSLARQTLDEAVDPAQPSLKMLDQYLKSHGYHHIELVRTILQLCGQKKYDEAVDLVYGTPDVRPHPDGDYLRGPFYMCCHKGLDHDKSFDIPALCRIGIQDALKGASTELGEIFARDDVVAFGEYALNDGKKYFPDFPNKESSDTQTEIARRQTEYFHSWKDTVISFGQHAKNLQGGFKADWTRLEKARLSHWFASDTRLAQEVDLYVNNHYTVAVIQHAKEKAVSIRAFWHTRSPSSGERVPYETIERILYWGVFDNMPIFIGNTSFGSNEVELTAGGIDSLVETYGEHRTLPKAGVGLITAGIGGLILSWLAFGSAAGALGALTTIWIGEKVFKIGQQYYEDLPVVKQLKQLPEESVNVYKQIAGIENITESDKTEE